MNKQVKYSNKICTKIHINSHFLLIAIILPLALSFFLFPDKPDKGIHLNSKFLYQTNVSGYLWNDLQTFFPTNYVSKFFNINLGLDWYNICIQNGSEALKNGNIILTKDWTPDLQKKYTMSVDIYPFKKNETLYNQDSFIKARDFQTGPTNQQDYPVYYSPLKAKPGENSCVKLSLSDEGYFYSPPRFEWFGSVSIPPAAKEQDYMKDVSTNIGSDKYEVRWGTSRFYMATDELTLWVNRILFVLAWVGLILLLGNIKEKLFNSAH